jgi:hypothetical protein
VVSDQQNKTVVSDQQNKTVVSGQQSWLSGYLVIWLFNHRDENRFIKM